jgi:tellurite resistance protein
MELEEKIPLLAKVAARAGRDDGTSILSLAAATYGSQPSDEATVPTGFDPAACALFESIVEGAYLVARADGIFDDAEKATFERVVAAACGGSVAPKAIAALVGDLEDQLEEDGMPRRIKALAEAVTRPEHKVEILRIAALIAQTSDDVSDVERGVLRQIAEALGLAVKDVDGALDDVTRAIAAAGRG